MSIQETIENETNSPKKKKIKKKKYPNRDRYNYLGREAFHVQIVKVSG